MNSFANEDLMWERLKDVQREVENHRLYGPQTPTAAELIRLLAKRAWWIARKPSAAWRVLSRWSAG